MVFGKNFVLALFFVAFSALLIAGCLEEKKFDTTAAFAAGQPTVFSIELPSVLPTAVPTQLMATATPRATPTPTPTPTPEPTALPIGSCQVITPRGVTSFDSPASVSIFVPFSGLPDEVVSAKIKCRDDDEGVDVEITRSGSSVFARRSCNYSPSSSMAYRIGVDASGTKCALVVSVNVAT